MKRFLAIAATAVISASTLTACFPLVVGAVGGGALVAADRRTPGAQLDDQTIELKASGSIRNVYANNVHVNLVSYNRYVLLVGSVPSETHRQRIEQMVKDTESVRGVYNELQVANSATLSQRSADSLLTARVKGALVQSPDLSAISFKVVTERSTVYLMGLVTQREADLATEIVRAVPGVVRVMRALEIISQEESQSTNGVASGTASPGVSLNPAASGTDTSSNQENTGVTVTPVP